MGPIELPPQLIEKRLTQKGTFCELSDHQGYKVIKKRHIQKDQL